MPDDLYKRDILVWAEQQAGLLGRLSRGERVNEAIDWPHLVEEVRDLGLSELRACTSLVRQAMIHLIKSAAWPASRSLSHWAVEATGFLDDAQQAFSPSMAQRIDLGKLYALAHRAAALATDDSGAPCAVAEECPWTLQELLAGDVPALLAKLGPPG